MVGHRSVRDSLKGNLREGSLLGNSSSSSSSWEDIKSISLASSGASAE